MQNCNVSVSDRYHHYFHLPHGPEADLKGEINIVGDETRKEEFGEGVHGDALWVDALAKAAARAACKYTQI